MGKLQNIWQPLPTISCLPVIMGFAAYGGVLGHDAPHKERSRVTTSTTWNVSGDGPQSFDPAGSDAGGKPPVLIENWVAWPIHCGFGDAELRNYGQEATPAIWRFRLTSTLRRTT